MNKTIRVKVIESSADWSIFRELREVVRYGELLYFFIWRDLKVRYRETMIGLLWVILQPLLVCGAIVFLFGRIKLGDSSVPYLLFVFSGLIVWQTFSKAASEGSAALINAREMINKIYFPRIILPMAKAAAQWVDLSISAVILFLLMIYYGLRINPSGLFYIAASVILLLIASISAAVLLAALNSRFRDIQHALPFLVQLGFFFSPIIYSGAALGKIHTFLFLNPATGIIEILRAGLFGQPVSGGALIFTSLYILVLFFASMKLFIWTDSNLTDTI